MTALTNAAENLLLSWLLTNGVATRPTAWFVQLHTANPGEEGTSGVLAGQARTAVTFGAPTNGVASNSAGVTISITAGGQITHISLWSASTGGTALAYGALATARTVQSGDTLSIPVGQLSLTLD
jgi:hypothetical protein